MRTWTQNAMIVLQKRYLLRDDAGQVVETPEGLLRRVSSHVAGVESARSRSWEERFFELMSDHRFLPNSPTLMNAGKSHGQLSACYVLPVIDHLDGIFEALKATALIHQSGGGTGFNFSNLRPRGARIRTTSGTSSGPVSFIEIFDHTTDIIKQGGTRRGANMAILNIDHPDVLDFVASKRTKTKLNNFNISVGVTAEFMEAVISRGDYGGRPAEELFAEICRSAWECGDPGLVFLDRMEFFNPTPLSGKLEATNPCGEQPLLPYESCNLGSLSVSRYLSSTGAFDWDQFREDIWIAVRFLDNVIEANHFPLSESRQITRANRKIGLGIMGFADLLLKLRISYASPDSRLWAERLMSFLDREAKLASAALAKERGPFRNWKQSLWRQLGYPQLRNATVSTVAPTGTISLLAGVSSGIEPIFATSFYRNVLDGERLLEVHPAVRESLEAQGLDPAKMSSGAMEAALGPIWRRSEEISPEDHIAVQGAAQRHSDSAVSKTINLRNDITVETVRRAYLMAYLQGCKGITVYRDGSKDGQVLEHSGIVCKVC